MVVTGKPVCAVGYGRVAFFVEEGLGFGCGRGGNGVVGLFHVNVNVG